MASPLYRPLQLETFVVRLWREAGSAVWRGEIIHLPDRAAPPADDDARFE